MTKRLDFTYNTICATHDAIAELVESFHSVNKSLKNKTLTLIAEAKSMGQNMESGLYARKDELEVLRKELFRRTTPTVVLPEAQELLNNCLASVAEYRNITREIVNNQIAIRANKHLMLSTNADTDSESFWMGYAKTGSGVHQFKIAKRHYNKEQYYLYMSDYTTSYGYNEYILLSEDDFMNFCNSVSLIFSITEAAFRATKLEAKYSWQISKEKYFGWEYKPYLHEAINRRSKASIPLNTDSFSSEIKRKYKELKGSTV